MSELVKLIKQVIKRELNDQGFTGKVISVDKANCTCVINTSGDDDTEREPDTTDVQLRSVIDGSSVGIITFPAVGSMVTVQMMFNDKGVLYVTSCAEVESVQVTIGAFKYLLNSDGMVFNDGANGGLINYAEVLKAVNYINALNTILEAWVPVSEAALKIALAPLIALPLPDVTNLEDVKIKH